MRYNVIKTKRGRELVNNVYEIIVKLLNGEYDVPTAADMLDSAGNTGKISDLQLVKKLILRLDSDENREYIWEKLLLRYIDVSIFDDHCFNYFLEDNICLNTLAHLDLQDRYLKILMRDYEEAYIFLARRYYKYDSYSPYELAELLSKCRYESVFYDLLLNRKCIDIKGNIIHKVIEKSSYAGSELKDFSRRVCAAEMLFCTDDTEIIAEYYEKKDNIYMNTISQNISAPDSILRELAQVSGIKYAAHIREQSRETLRIKALLDK